MHKFRNSASFITHRSSIVLKITEYIRVQTNGLTNYKVLFLIVFIICNDNLKWQIKKTKEYKSRNLLLDTRNFLSVGYLPEFLRVADVGYGCRVYTLHPYLTPTRFWGSIFGSKKNFSHSGRGATMS